MLKIESLGVFPPTMRLLVLGSDEALIDKLKKCLGKHYILDVETEGASGVYAAQCDFYSLILIDYVLSDMSGKKLCKLLRQQEVNKPIIMLTNGSNSRGVVSSLRSGADDCIKRSFNPEELRARVNALIRRFSPSIPKDNIFKIGNVCIDFWKRVIIKGEEQIRLKDKEFKLLHFFLENKNRTLSRDQILEALWKDDSVRDFSIVDVYVCYLRKSLDEIFDVELIHTIYGVGYVFDDSKLRNSS